MILKLNASATRYFLDTEFYEDGKTIDLISIGIKCSDGRKLYFVNSEARLDMVSPWIRDNVLPYLPNYSDPSWSSKSDIATKVKDFVLDDGKPIEFWGYFADYDWIVLAQLFGTMMNLPKHFPRFCLDLKQLMLMLDLKEKPTQTSKAHHALADAEWSEMFFNQLTGF